MIANVLIAIGAILPGIGGTATRMGYTEVLYVTELAGLLLTWTGYRMSIRPVARARDGLTSLIGDEHASAIELTAFRQLELHAHRPGSRNAGTPPPSRTGWMLRPISSITPACSSDVAKLPPLITMMSLPGCAFSLRTNVAGVARDQLGVLVRRWTSACARTRRP